MRLRGTVVLYKGDPVQIQEIREGTGKEDILRVLIKPLPLTTPGAADMEGNVFPVPPVPQAAVQRRGAGGLMDFARQAVEAAKEEGGVQKYISSKHFDIAPFPLGYVNKPTDSGAFYCSRMPNRVQKQGLCAENFKGTDNYKGLVDFRTFLRCKEVPLMVAGNYPTFEQALKNLTKVPSVAFNRYFCLVRDEVIADLVYVYHRGMKVGMLNKVTGDLCLGERFLCLKESLTELGLKVGGC
jgi:hypothetical protein